MSEKSSFSGFISYAQADKPWVDRFLDLMKPRCQILKEIEMDLWWDRKILVGEPWEQRLAAEMENADFGLFCITPNFLASEFVTKIEIPAFLEQSRTIFPVGIEQVDFVNSDLKGLDDLQIFRHSEQRADKKRWFSECNGLNRTRFCDQLVQQMVDRLTRLG